MKKLFLIAIFGLSLFSRETLSMMGIKKLLRVDISRKLHTAALCLRGTGDVSSRSMPSIDALKSEREESLAIIRATLSHNEIKLAQMRAEQQLLKDELKVAQQEIRDLKEQKK